MKVTCKFLSY